MACAMFWLDSLYLVLIVVAALLGAWTGFLWQAARLFSLAAAAASSLWFHDTAVQYLRTHLALEASEPALRVVAYVGVFLVVYLVLYFATRLMYAGLYAVNLQRLDRWCGALLGAGKMVMLLAVFSLAARHCDHPLPKQWLGQATVAPTLANALTHAIALIPDDTRRDWQQTWDHLGELVQRDPAKQSASVDPPMNGPVRKAPVR